MYTECYACQQDVLLTAAGSGCWSYCNELGSSHSERNIIVNSYMLVLQDEDQHNNLDLQHCRAYCIGITDDIMLPAIARVIRTPRACSYTQIASLLGKIMHQNW